MDLTTLEKEIPRYEEPNPLNYTNLELAKRKKSINDALKDYPNLPAKWIEWVYDLIENKPPDEVKQIINEGLWEKKLQERDLGGIIKGGVEIIENENKIVNN